MKKEYYVTHSKYKNNKSWENALTFTFEGKLKDVKPDTYGTYNYYHNGQLIWSEVALADLWLNFVSDCVMVNVYDYDALCENYPIYEKYSDSVDQFAKKEYHY